MQDLIVLAEFLFKDIRSVAHWKLDETEGTIAYDNTSDKHGTLYGEPLWRPAGGQVDGALEFDGVDDHVGTPFVLDPAKVSFSIFAWNWHPRQSSQMVNGII